MTVTKIEFSHEYMVRSGSNRTFSELRTDDFAVACRQFDAWATDGGLVSLRRSPDGLLVAEAMYGSVREPDLRSKVAAGNLSVPSDTAAISHKVLSAPRILRVVRGVTVQEVF